MKLLTHSIFLATTSLVSAAIAPDATISGAKQDPAGVEFFEKNIRPVLAQKCYGCHSAESGKQKGGLLLDTREGIRMGGDSGHAVVPGDAKESLLLDAIRYDDKETQMPPQKEGGKLPDAVIANFEQWIRIGAPDPRDGTGAVKMTPIAKKDWDLKKAKEFWAFQEPKAVPAPEVKDKAWPRSDADKFILGALEAKGLNPVADADKSTLIRRVYFDLIGLPPRPDEVDAFLADASPTAFEKVVDRLLASLQFGERWGATGWTLRATPRAPGRSAISRSRPRGGIAIMSSRLSMRTRLMISSSRNRSPEICCLIRTTTSATGNSSPRVFSRWDRRG